MSRFKGNYFHFLPRKGKGRKTSKLPGSCTGRQASIWAPRLPLEPLCRCPEVTASASAEFTPAKDKWISRFIKRGRGVPLLTSLDPPLISAFPAHYVTASPEDTHPLPHLQAGRQPPGICKPEREATLDLQGGAESSALGLARRPSLLSGAPHAIGKPGKLKTKIIELPTPDVSRLWLCRVSVFFSCLVGDNSKHFLSPPLQIVVLLNYKSNVTIFPIN